MLQCDQRGGRKGTWGVVDNVMIDAMVLEECRMRKKNLSCTWVDVATAYDSVSHNWLLKTLELHRIPLAITNTIRKLSTQWKTKLRVRTQSGVELTDPIQFKRGIYQGETLFPLLFIMCFNPMSWKLGSLPGYKMAKPVNISVSHGLFMDDLKLYSKHRKTTWRKNGSDPANDVGYGLNNGGKEDQIHLNSKREAQGTRPRVETSRGPRDRRSG